MSLNVQIGMDKVFEKYKGRKIALYGLGTETKRLLQKLGNDYKIVGLLDSFKTDGLLYEKEIISLDDALDMGIELIIVVARPGSCRAITKKIEERCRKNGIALMDIRGKDLLEIKKVSYTFSDVNGVTKAELKDKIMHFDVVSFDLFDTLVMRQTLYSDDVVEYVEYRLREKGIFIEDFCKKRLESEKELARNTAPTLVEIYQNMLQKLKCKTVDVAAGELAKLEWDTDFGMLVPREEVCDVFRETVDMGKPVYVVSDTYYSKIQLAQVLEKCGITKYTDILSSCDYKISKAQGLYKILKDREKLKSSLHIGDDSIADMENARSCGLETCRVYSGLDLLEEIGTLGLSDFMISLTDRLKVGMFVSRIFNSPFQFERGDGRIEISDVYDVGYLICAPMISDFVYWFYEKIREQRFQNIWFGARDGYLIKRMYDYLLESYNQKDKTIYFLTSRTAAIRAGVKDEKDIQYVDEMKFSGTLEENLKERFGIDAGTVKCDDISVDASGLMKYKNAIMANAVRESQNYQKYISKLNIEEGDTAFFDFVAKGTTQKYVQRLVNHHLKGFYFLQLEKEQMKGSALDIQSFYENDELNICSIYENYYFLETLLTASHSSVQGFNEEGEPVYAVETRKEKDILCFERAQKGIYDYFRNYVRLYPKLNKMTNKALDEVFLELIHKIRITDSDFMDLVVEDSFFNRMTNIADIL